ncbi:hypothetical protein D3C76_1700340 [compost metagenome]
MPLLTQLVHNGNHLGANPDKDRLPAVRKLFVTEGKIHLMTEHFGELLIRNLTALMLMEGVAHRKSLLKRCQRNAAEITPCSQHTIEVDIDDYVS